MGQATARARSTGESGHGATSPRRANSDALRQRAFALRCQRWQYREIAEELGIPESTAHGLVRSELGRLQAETAESALEVREMERQRLDEIERKIVARITNPNLDRDGNPESLAPHVMALLKLQERRAKLLGLDAPTQVQVSGTVAVVHFNLDALDDGELETLRALVAKCTPAHATGGALPPPSEAVVEVEAEP